MISLEQVTIRFGNFELLSEISLMINPKDRVGLVGKNGAGKTTILRLFIGQMAPSDGTVTVPMEIKLGYLPQIMETSDSTTVYKETEKAFEEVLTLQRELNELNQSLAERTDYESDEYHQIIHDLTDKSDRFEMLEGQNREGEIEKTLFGLGFERKDLNRATSEFSGGWRMRIELAKILLQRPHALLLDEPTNHLDIESIQWLEDYLADFQGAVLLISHDRTFLDRVTQRTVEITLGRLNDYRVPYTEFLRLRAERREQQFSAYQNQQKMITETEKFIERFRYKATKAVQVQSRIKQLEKIDRIEIDEIDGSTIHIKFPPAPHSGNLVIEAKGIGKRYGNHTVLSGVDFVLEKGEKVAFVGRNGEGKTTLAKMILNQIPFDGDLRVGHQVKIGYYAQDQADLLDPNKTILETVDYAAVGEVRTKMRDILGAFLFSGEDIGKKVSVLSGGERSRLALACMLLEPRNLLLLDEPTNHLDLRSKQVLKEALTKFDGTLVIVSHDRDFLDGLVSKIYEFKHRNVKEHPGDIFEFLQKKRLDSLQELERRNLLKPSKSKSDPSDKKIKFEERKEIERKRRKVESQIAAIEKKIHETESKIGLLEHLLSNPKEIEQGSEMDLFGEFEKFKKELDDLLEEWEAAHQYPNS